MNTPHGALIRKGLGYCCARVSVTFRGRATDRACNVPAIARKDGRPYCPRHIPITDKDAAKFDSDFAELS